MNTYEKIVKLADKDFKLKTGVTREVFDTMLEVLKSKYAKEHTQGGQPACLESDLLQVYTITGIIVQ